MAKVYVLLFNARTENEGIHTVQMGDRNKILMFESEDDATRYALLLEAQDFPAPTVEPFDSEEIEAFCQDADYDWELVPDGQLAIPPEQNVDDLDWEGDGKSQKTGEPDSPSDLSSEELDKIRRKLEGLL
ncbi:DUF3110 domain-containing protein [Crocosphaera sp. UHCC 0190]|uniref:DUF3110 domain-containing protein n=1 Tax=Crocosphaera sp. UHCC 0190 TaxID=3110246 RepID=UPI002B1F391A|nr:DUF3110 domain-containing protein [Crocosphaera sp. UHCC 0190]MEA5512069.1 DUF3110 domain-containing protein [Crocosphaera sp. UHCC 0190]